MRLRQLQQRGIRSWHDAITDPQQIPASLRSGVVTECQQALQALQNDDIRWFVDRLHARDKWRILSQYLDRTSFFDIETTGLEYDSTITVIVCWHQGRLHTFIEHENLDDFLDLLDDVQLLASFNGSSFDVPRILDGFHIPALPCPHLDLRWPGYHQGLQGSLKQITTSLGLSRPADLHDADGALAVRLWNTWLAQQDAAARSMLLRYCAADVLMLVMLAQHLAQRTTLSAEDLWAQLPAGPTMPEAAADNDRQQRFLQGLFGSASPRTLRTRRLAAGRR